MSEHSSPTGNNCDAQGSNKSRASKRPRISFQQGVINILEEEKMIIKQERDRYYEYGSFLQGEKILREIDDRKLRNREQIRRREEKKNRKEEEAQKKERESLEKKIRKLKKENDDLKKENTNLVEKNDNLITENTEIKNKLERRTKQNELTEAKLRELQVFYRRW